MSRGKDAATAAGLDPDQIAIDINQHSLPNQEFQHRHHTYISIFIDKTAPSTRKVVLLYHGHMPPRSRQPGCCSDAANACTDNNSTARLF